MRDRKFFMQKNQWVAGRKVPSFLAMACFFLTILCPSILKAVENQLPQLKIANAFLGTRYDSDQQRTAFDAHEKIFLYIDIIGPVIQPAELACLGRVSCQASSIVSYLSFWPPGFVAQSVT
jgi:hypothetical protein